MYYIRRGNGGGPCPADDGWVFDNSNKQWTELPRCATPRVWGAMAPLSNDSGKAVLYGGLVLRRQVISVSVYKYINMLVPVH